MSKKAESDVASRGVDRAAEVGPTERLQKILSAAGVASRRLSESLIQQGRVSVNGDGRDRARHEGRSGARRCARGWTAGPRRVAPPLHPAQQAARLRHDAQRSAGTADRHGSADGVREYVYPVGPPRLRLGRPAAPDQRRRAGGEAHAPAPRCGARVRSARPWRSRRPRGRTARARHHARWTSHGAGARGTSAAADVRARARHRRRSRSRCTKDASIRCGRCSTPSDILSSGCAGSGSVRSKTSRSRQVTTGT